MKLILFEQIAQDIQSEHGFHIGFYCFVSSLCHISNQIEELDEILPSTDVLFTADLVVISKSSLLQNVFIDCGLSIDLIIFFGKRHLIEASNVVSSQLLNEKIEELYLVACVDAFANNAEQSENLKILLLVKDEGVLLINHSFSQFAH